MFSFVLVVMFCVNGVKDCISFTGKLLLMTSHW